MFIMDSYETLNLEAETSLLLMQELIEWGQGGDRGDRRHP